MHNKRICRIFLKPGHSLHTAPSHWGIETIPASWHGAILSWCWGDDHLKASQCGQSELIAYLARHCGSSIKSSFIDIGANDGTTKSSTELLSSLGFHGILVEPNPILASQLRKTRPNEVVFNCACGNQYGITTLETCYQISGLGTLSSIADPRAANRLNQEARRSGYQIIHFPCILIPASVLYTYAHSHLGSITFLKVDAEGSEEMILSDIMDKCERMHLPLFIEVENNYRDLSASQILRRAYTLLCVMDSFVEIYVRSDMAKTIRPHAIKFFEALASLVTR